MMPLYAYEDPQTGFRVEERRTVEQRNAPCIHNGRTLRRISAPERIGIPQAVPNPYTMEAQMQRGLRERELRGDMPGGKKRANALRKIWGSVK